MSQTVTSTARQQPPDKDALLVDAIGGLNRARLQELARQFGVSSVQGQLATLWAELLTGANISTMPERAREIGSLAAKQALSGCVLGAQAACALAYLSQGDTEQATTAARRASRMAATEGLPSWGRLVNLVLARARRHAGRPYLALWICRALQRDCPPPFGAWLTWEMLLSGYRNDDNIAGGPDTAPGALHQLLVDLTNGVIANLPTHIDALYAATAGWSDQKIEVQTLLDLLSQTRVPSDVARAWCNGEGNLAPFGLAGVCANDAEEKDIPRGAFVCVAPGRPGRRVLLLGPPIALPGDQGSEVVAAQSGHVRTDSALCILALAGPKGHEVAEFFKLVYGFPYEPSVHRSVLDTLMRRMRLRLRNSAALQREAQNVSVLVTSQLFIPDPRCAFDLADVVLHELARRGAVSANELAASLAVSLRSVQLALQQLNDDGACEVRKEGRQVTYELSDTTFTSSNIAL